MSMKVVFKCLLIYYPIILNLYMEDYMKKESITICANNQIEAERLREQFNQEDNTNKYRLNIIISGEEEPVLSLSQFLLAKMK